MSNPNTLLNNELRKVQNYNSSIVGSFSSSGNVLTLSNISSTSIDGLPVISLNSLTNSQLNLGRVTVLPQNSITPIKITGLLGYMQQAIQQAYSNNSSNNSVLYPFSNQNLYGQGIDLVQLTRNLAANSVATQGVNLGNFTYILNFVTKSIIMVGGVFVAGCNIVQYNVDTCYPGDGAGNFSDTAVITANGKVYYNINAGGACRTCNSLYSDGCPINCF